MSPFSSLSEVFAAFNRLKVMVIGDVMLDAYLWGKVDRISPEAPVPVVTVHKRESRLGGAANVAINLLAMGAEPLLCSVIGDDRNGEELKLLLKEMNMNTSGLVQSTDRVTTVKTRVIGNNHQLIRVDDEVLHGLSEKEQHLLLERVRTLLDSHQPNVVIFEDYDKGVLDENTIEQMIYYCKERSIPTAVDPKKKNFMHYRGVTLFKPNLAELKAGLKVDLDKTDVEQLYSTSRHFQESQDIEMLMVTLSEAGVYYCRKNEHAILPAHIRNISDVSGAGDTVISVASLCLALGLSAKNISALANLAGGLVCEKVGVVPIDKSQLQQEAAHLII